MSVRVFPSILHVHEPLLHFRRNERTAKLRILSNPCKLFFQTENYVFCLYKIYVSELTGKAEEESKAK